MSWVRERWRSTRRAIRRQLAGVRGTPAEKARAAFDRACWRLLPGDTAIDCGANIGIFTLQLAATGAHVYAFEPNPTALEVLRERTAAMPNVTVVPSAVSVRSGRARLFMHEDSTADPLAASQAGSLVASKSNVSTDRFEEVDLADFSAFLTSLDGPVALVKMDIEGTEIQLLRHLLDTGAIARIRRLFVEMHDLRIPALMQEGAELRRRLEKVSSVSINLDWR